MDPAIEELLRHQTPVMMVPRIIAQDCELGGVEMKAGDSATLMIGAANVDEAEFDDVRRGAASTASANRHLAFGGGPHRCLGSHLARLELRVALEEFHKRIPEYEIADGTEIHFSPGIRQADHLPLVFPVKRLSCRASGVQRRAEADRCYRRGRRRRLRADPIRCAPACGTARRRRAQVAASASASSTRRYAESVDRRRLVGTDTQMDLGDRHGSAIAYPPPACGPRRIRAGV